ncbi:MAG TPA: carbon monoxide dehydrogenase subunit G [Kofleriaceae bacterium]|nr:carbon monoxide dehydrogenase subunit G [Kofleriaceae bacterium]
MKLEGDYLFDASVPEVWSALFDPVILAAVMPGCEKLDLVDGSYVGEIKIKVGPIQGKFTGKVDLTDKDEPNSYKMVVDGRGAPGFVKATAVVKLAPEGAGTRVSYDADAQVGGKIASVGQRLIEASARAIVAQSLEGLHTNIKLRARAYREAAALQAAAAPAAAAEPAAAEPAALPTALNSQVTDVMTPAVLPTAVNSQVTDVVTPTALPTALNNQVTDVVTPAALPTAVNSQVTDVMTPAALPTAVNSQITDVATPDALPTAVNSQITDVATPAAPPTAVNSQVTDVATSAEATPAAPAAAEPAKPAAPTVVPPAVTAAPPPATPVVFTPVKAKQSDLANAVAKEVASSMFPRSVLVAIILIEALVIVWLLLRH